MQMLSFVPINWLDVGHVKENALYITKEETQVAGKITDPCMSVQLRDAALRPVSIVELHMCRIIAKEREPVFPRNWIKMANTKFDLFKRALVTYHSAPFFRNFCWNVNQGRNFIYTVEGGGGRGGDGGNQGKIEWSKEILVTFKRKSEK